jgi:hypothetical protein
MGRKKAIQFGPAWSCSAHSRVFLHCILVGSSLKMAVKGRNIEGAIISLYTVKIYRMEDRKH